MKFLVRVTIIVLSILVFSVTTIYSQNQPNMSADYTVEQIDEMHKKHRISRPRDTNPSQELINRFLSDFPDARDIEWEKSEVFYEVEFEVGLIASKDFTAYYDMSNKLVMYKEEISTRSIPTLVKNSIAAKYPSYRIEDADKLVKGKATFYKLELEKGDFEVEVLVNAEGVVINEAAN